MDSLKIAYLNRDIVGADRGFNVRDDILHTTVDGVPLVDIYQDFIDALAEWNKSRSALSALFTFSTTDSFVQLPQNPAKTTGFEKASQFGVPQAIRREVNYFRMGYPLDWDDAATRYTEAFLRDATAEQVRLQFEEILNLDNTNVYLKTMKALTDKVTSGNRDTNENGVQIFDLWDGSSGEVPPPFGGRTFSSTHDHYLISGAATLDSGDVEALINTIQEHGYGLPESNERIIIMVNPGEHDAITTWRAGEANANGAVAKFDFIPSTSAPAYLTETTIVGQTPPATFQTLPITGGYGDAWIHKNYAIPVGYVLAVATSGPGSTRNPLAFREHVRPEHRGLLLRRFDSHPLRNSYFQRGFGVGVRNRSAAAVMQIKASGSYDNPTWTP